jgi:hypothetical protein
MLAVVAVVEVITALVQFLTQGLLDLVVAVVEVLIL